MRRNRRRGAFSKEKIVMAASTVLVLGTLTVIDYGWEPEIKARMTAMWSI